MNKLVIRFRFGDDLDLNLPIDKAVGDVVVVVFDLVLGAPFIANVAPRIDNNVAPCR